MWFIVSMILLSIFALLVLALFVLYRMQRALLYRPLPQYALQQKTPWRYGTVIE